MLLSDKHYNLDDLDIFNLLKRPVWVFHIAERRMYWANRSAVDAVWHAESLQELLARDFKADLTKATEMRLDEVLRRCKAGEVVTEQWTLYPNGKPENLGLTMSGIRTHDGQVAVLVEADITPQSYEESTIRSLEILRHLPVPVSKFNEAGDFLYENPQATTTYGLGERSLMDHFVDKEVGQHILNELQAGKDCNVEGELYTRSIDEESKQDIHPQSSRSFSIAVRRVKDPVSSEPVILLTARDITEILLARKERQEASVKADFLAILAHDVRTPIHQIIG